MQASGIFAGCNTAKMQPGGIRESQFMTHSICGHLSLRLSGFRAKPLTTAPEPNLAHASKAGSLAPADVFKHSYYVQWLAAEPMARRIPHRLTRPLAASASSQRSPTASAASASSPSALQQGAQQQQLQLGSLAEQRMLHEVMMPSQRWLAGGWSLFAQNKLFARTPRQHRSKGKQQHKKLQHQKGMDATCAAMQLMQSHQKGEIWRRPWLG